jgi:hypothetical protein
MSASPPGAISGRTEWHYLKLKTAVIARSASDAAISKYLTLNKGLLRSARNDDSFGLRKCHSCRCVVACNRLFAV